MNGDVFDVIIIGGGPAGLSAAMYAARAKLGTLVLDKNPAAGALGAADRIENYPGVTGPVRGSELLATMRAQAESFGASIMQLQAFGVDIADRPFRVYAGEETFSARALILATGAMGRAATLKGEAEFTGRGVSYCATCDAAFYRDKTVAVAGASSEVIDEIGTLAKFARSINFITREKEIPPDARRALDRFGTVIVTEGARVDEIFGGESVTGLRVALPDGAQREIAADGVFLFLHGNRPVTDFLFGAVETTPEGCIRVDRETMATSVEGVFATGDVTCKKVRQAVLAAAEGCLAALAAGQYVNRGVKIVPQWGKKS
jgi:thioredoxin reductase (NADPH)